MQQRYFSPRQVARAIRVSEASVKRWCDRGGLACERTAGGHRRIPLSTVVEFLKSDGRDLVEPELLGLPANVGSGELPIARAQDEALDSLLTGDEPRLRALTVNLYLAGRSLMEICDRVLAPGCNALGDLWEHGQAAVYQERRACELCHRVLHELETLLAPPPAGARRALGGSPDHYSLSSGMVALVLRELGWRAESLGSGLPLDELALAAETERPELLWLCVSHVEDTRAFLREFQRLYQRVLLANVPLVVGGRALTPDLRSEMRFAVHCERLEQLAAFVQGLGTARR